MIATYEGLAEWADSRRLQRRTMTTGTPGHRVRKLMISGAVCVTFGESLPRVVVEWGDACRADFGRGVAIGPLTYFIAGLLPPKAIGYGTAVTVEDSAVCTEPVDDPDDDEGPAECRKPSRFVVERSDGDASYGSGGGTEEACEQHLADVVGGMIDGYETVRAIVSIRWDKTESAIETAAGARDARETLEASADYPVTYTTAGEGTCPGGC